MRSLRHPVRRAGVLLISLALVALAAPTAVVSAVAPYVEYHDVGNVGEAQHVADLTAGGYRPISLTIYGTAAAPRYAAVWVHRGGPAFVEFHDLTAAQYQTAFNLRASHGDKVTIIAATGSGAGARFAGLFVHISTPTVAAHGLDSDGLVQQSKTENAAGYVLISAAMYGTGSATRYATVYQPNSANYGSTWATYADHTTYEADFAAYTAGDARPGLVTMSADQRYLAIWRDDSIGPWYAHDNMTQAQYETQVAGLPAGYHVIAVQAAGDGSAVRYAATFARTDLVTPRKWTATGAGPAGLSGFDSWVKALMKKDRARAGALAIVRDGKLLYARGFTWAEPGFPITKPTSLFRIASSSKALTSIAIHRLMQAARPLVSQDTTMQSLLDVQTASNGAPTDSRWNDITVAELLGHAGGFLTTKQFDPMFSDLLMAHSSTDLPATQAQIESYMAGRPLAYTPGTDSHYSNFGFVLLGRIIEHVTGLTYPAAMKSLVFSPLGLTRPSIGKSLLAGRKAAETPYEPRDPWIGNSVMSPSYGLVPGPDGTFNLSNLDSAGGWVLAAPDYAKVLASFDLGAADPLLTPASVGTMWSPPTAAFPNTLRGWFLQPMKNAHGGNVNAYWHNGSLPGTASLVIHRADGLSFVLFLDRDVPGFLQASAEGLQLNKIANKVHSWPTRDLFPSVGIPAFPSR